MEASYGTPLSATGFLFSRRRGGFSEDGRTRARAAGGAAGWVPRVGELVRRLRCLIAIGRWWNLYTGPASSDLLVAAAVGVGFVAPKSPFSPRSGPVGRALDGAWTLRLLLACGVFGVPSDPSFLLPQCFATCSWRGTLVWMSSLHLLDAAAVCSQALLILACSVFTPLPCHCEILFT